MADTPPVAASGARSVAVGGDVSGTVITGDVRVEVGQVPAARQVRVSPDAPVHRLEAPRTGTFVGRDLDGLRALLTRAPAVRQVVHGMAGVGKSELVRQYAHAYRDEYPVACWITADSPQNLELGLSGLAAALHPPIGLVGDAAMAAGWALDWLQSHPGWLVVLDNVDDPADVRACVDRLSRGHLVITTRRDVFWPGLNALSLPVLDGPAALELLRSIAGESPGEVLAEIAAELGHLPLALEQAAAYMNQERRGPARYLRELRADPARAHARSPQGGDAERIIARLWNHHVTALGEHEHLLRVLACLAPDDVPRSLFGDAWDDGLAALASYSMITRSGCDETETISMHRLFQSVIRHGLDHDDPRQERARATALSVLMGAFPGDPATDVSSWAAWRDLLPHIDALASRCREGDEHTDLSLLLSRAGVFLMAQGRHERAHDLAVRALAIAERGHGPYHPTIATYLGNLAGALSNLGRPGEALPLEERALAIAEAAHRPDHPEIANQLGNLAQILHDLGRSAEAVPLARRALAITQASYAADHPRVALRLSNLGVTLQALGRAAEAVPLFRQALAVSESAFGPGHPETATPLGNLAAALHVAGRPGEALPLEQRALAITEAAYGPDHPHVAARLGNLALGFSNLGRSAEALPLEERALAIVEAALGPGHPEMALRLGNLAATLHNLGRPGEALPLFERASAIVETALGPDHPATATWLNNRAHSLLALGRPHEAIPLAERAIGVTEKAFGPGHPDLAVLLDTLAVGLRDTGQPAEAAALLERCLSITEAAYGPGHPDVVVRLNNLAAALRGQGRPEDAVPLLERALRLAETVHGPDHAQAVALRVALRSGPDRPGRPPATPRRPSGTSG